MTTTEIDLASLFNVLSKELLANQAVLNEADTYNHNHGDNMVNNFKVITKALKQKQDAPPSEQLAYASQVLQKRSTSGSAQLYASGLANAAEAVRGQPTVTPENTMGLIQALMGGGQASHLPRKQPSRIRRHARLFCRFAARRRDSFLQLSLRVGASNLAIWAICSDRCLAARWAHRSSSCQSTAQRRHGRPAWIAARR